MKARLAWPPAGRRNTASSRLRAYLPCDHLRRDGWPCEIFDPARAEEYRAVVFQKKYDAASLDLAQRLQRRGTRVVFDLCDNHFHYDLDQPEVQEERSRNLERMLETADRVTVSTPTLGEVVRQRSGRRFTVIDDMVEEDGWSPLYRLWGRLARARSEVIRLVWFGVAGQERPPFGLIDLAGILPRLEKFGAERPVSLTVISNSRQLAERYVGGCDLQVIYRDWSSRRFPFLFAPHHIAVLPINPNPLTLCKTSNRAVLSLQLGVPVVADAIPSYEELADFIMLSDWRKGLSAYAESPQLRRDHVRRGQVFLRSRFAPRRIASQWAEVFRNLVVIS